MKSRNVTKQDSDLVMQTYRSPDTFEVNEDAYFELISVLLDLFHALKLDGRPLVFVELCDQLGLDAFECSPFVEHVAAACEWAGTKPKRAPKKKVKATRKRKKTLSS